MAKLPFQGRVFFKVLPFVLVLLAVSLWVMHWVNEELTGADKVMGPLSAIILTYLIHLWMLPGEELPEEGEEEKSEPEASDPPPQ